MNVCEFGVLNEQKRVLFEERPSTVRDSLFEISSKQLDNVTYESVIHSAIVPFEISILQLRVSIIKF